MIRIGLISDTHGLLRPEALAFLAGCDRIVHAGDIGGPQILQELARIAPVVAVRGNNDVGAWADALRDVETIDAGGVAIAVVHDRTTLGFEPAARGVAVVVSGHSHRPRVDEGRAGVLDVNPGSAGPRRFRLPVSVGELRVERGRAVARIETLAI